MPQSVPVHSECAPRFSRVREAFEQNFASGEVGAALAVTIDGRPVIDLWGGYADAARTRPWERETIVNVYSTTNGMTAICANRLIDTGQLDLDAPVATYWPEFAQGGKETLPVRYLLSHQAGLAAITVPIPKEKRYDWSFMTTADLRSLRSTPPTLEPLNP